MTLLIHQQPFSTKTATFEMELGRVFRFFSAAKGHSRGTQTEKPPHVKYEEAEQVTKAKSIFHTRIQAGKHQGKTIGFVITNHPKYTKYISTYNAKHKHNLVQPTLVLLAKAVSLAEAIDEFQK